jgi:hypothetical protein
MMCVKIQLAFLDFGMNGVARRIVGAAIEYLSQTMSNK